MDNKKDSCNIPYHLPQSCSIQDSFKSLKGSDNKIFKTLKFMEFINLMPHKYKLNGPDGICNPGTNDP